MDRRLRVAYIKEIIIKTVYIICPHCYERICGVFQTGELVCPYCNLSMDVRKENEEE